MTILNLTPDIMVDLETLGTAPGSVIVSIGAVAFNARSGHIGESFYALIDVADAQASGLAIDAATVAWWVNQSIEVREALRGFGSVPLGVALHMFSGFYRAARGERFWSHGANFDAPLLDAAYRAVGQAPPWKFWESRCTRTLFDLAGVRPDRTEGEHHNALDDAMAQAKAAIKACDVLADREKANDAEAALRAKTDVRMEFDDGGLRDFLIGLVSRIQAKQAQGSNGAPPSGGQA